MILEMNRLLPPDLLLVTDGIVRRNMKNLKRMQVELKERMPPFFDEFSNRYDCLHGKMIDKYMSDSAILILKLYYWLGPNSTEEWEDIVRLYLRRDVKAIRAYPDSY